MKNKKATPETFDCNCSLHGRQPMVAILVWARVELGCGCIWVRQDGQWVYEGNKRAKTRKNPKNEKAI